MCLTQEGCGGRFLARWPVPWRRPLVSGRLESKPKLNTMTRDFSILSDEGQFSSYVRRAIRRPAEEEGMSKQILGLLAVALLVFCAPIALSQMEQAQPVYIYVSQFQVPRANWAQYAEETDKTVNPIFERLMTDGTLVGWGNFD